MIELHKDVQNRIRASPDMSILLSFFILSEEEERGKEWKKANWNWNHLQT
jgi:hypothetical protein